MKICNDKMAFDALPFPPLPLVLILLLSLSMLYYCASLCVVESILPSLLHVLPSAATLAAALSLSAVSAFRHRFIFIVITLCFCAV